MHEATFTKFNMFMAQIRLKWNVRISNLNATQKKLIARKEH